MLARRKRGSPTIFTIPSQRMTYARSMLAYLMFFAGDKLKQHKRCINPFIVTQ